MLRELEQIATKAADGTTGLKVLQSDVRADLVITDVSLRAASTAARDGRIAASVAAEHTSAFGNRTAARERLRWVVSGSAAMSA